MTEQNQENSEVPQVKASNGSTSVGSINVGGDAGGDINIGNTTHNYYYQNIEKNTQPQPPIFGSSNTAMDFPPTSQGGLRSANS